MHEVGTPIQGRPVAVPETRPNGDPERSPKGEQGRTRDTKPILQAPPPLPQTDPSGREAAKGPVGVVEHVAHVNATVAELGVASSTSRTTSCRPWIDPGAAEVIPFPSEDRDLRSRRCELDEVDVLPVSGAPVEILRAVNVTILGEAGGGKETGV